MALIQDAQTSWSVPMTLMRDEIWQARHGCLFVTTTEDPVPLDGIALIQNTGLKLRAGVTVRYRKEGSTSALIVREAV